ncbi:MAG TPA: DUF6576 domain-containing protein [Ohtaekwangia sp.]|uniref:DUF6576 domain-containing protein n=1 Tax=Ohtaekwangia sp. TaxID=2066019 RepID=UPI002F94ACDD
MGLFGILIVAAIVSYIFRDSLFGRNLETKDDKYNAARKQRMDELDRLLDKINTRGIDSLTPGEKRRLDELSGKK